MDAGLKLQVECIVVATHECIEAVIAAKERFDDVRTTQAAKVKDLKVEIEAVCEDMCDEDLLEILPSIQELAFAAMKIAEN